MHPHVSGTESVGFLKARRSWKPGSQNSDIHVRTWNLVHGNSQISQNWISVSGHETQFNRWIFPFLPFAKLAQVHCTCTPMFLEQKAWVSLKQDARGNLVVKTPIFVSGHETQSMAIPKLGKTWISVSGHETRSNRWIFLFLPFAEGVCCERPLDVIIIPTNCHMTVPFFSGRNNICISFSSNYSNTFQTYKMY